MIVSYCPLRVSLLGGGSDLPSFYSQFGGSCLGFSLDKRIAIVAYQSFDQDSYLLKYSATERVKRASQIKHPIFREALKLYSVPPINITSESEITAGTGLGSSSAFSVALIQAIKALNGNIPRKNELAEEACELEIDILKMPIGKQDQYLSALGGMNHLTFEQNGKVHANPLKLSKDDEEALVDNLIMINIGGERQASTILAEQSEKLKGDKTVVDKAKVIKQLCDEFMKSPTTNFQHLGWYLNEAWSVKRQLTSKISSNYIDELYDASIKSGAFGGKVLGAGGAGFLLLVVPKEKQQDLLAKLKRPFIKPRIAHDGAGFFTVNNR